MNEYTPTKEDLVRIADGLRGLIEAARSLPLASDERFDDWARAVAAIRQQLDEEIVRVAVVGSIKSGKSTFSNALFKGDYLKRGAGVVTSIVTRIRRGDRLRAVLRFKSWETINADIAQALQLFPADIHPKEDRAWDIRRSEDRQALARALDSAGEALLTADGTLNVNCALLSLYLAGYDRIRQANPDGAERIVFIDAEFARHRDFVGDDTLAVFLSDVGLEITGAPINGAIEIADCQGSDSPNPLHLAMIQEYLMQTHLIVYVISSRTGLRQADIRFLSMIRKMGIVGNALFVVNCDLGEHESLEDLERLIGRVRSELGVIVPAADIFAYSTLLNLYRGLSAALPEKERLRLRTWETEQRLIAYSDEQTRRFDAAFFGRLSSQRLSLLFENHVERLDVITTGIEQWARIRQELLGSDADGARDLLEKLAIQRKRLEKVRSLVQSTLAGTAEKIKKELRVDIDQFFGTAHERILHQIREFVERYEAPLDRYEKKLEIAGFANTFYVVFQDFRQDLEGFTAESIQPQVVRFARALEVRIIEALEGIAEPFQAMTRERFAEFAATFRLTDRIAPGSERNASALVDLASLKRMVGLALPSMSTAIRYSARVRTEAVVRFGVYSMAKVIRKLLKKPARPEREEHLRALRDGVRRLKRETDEALVFHFKNYRENFKFQYMFKLVDVAVGQLDAILRERFNSVDADLSGIRDLMAREANERDAVSGRIAETARLSGALIQDIDGIRQGIRIRARRN